MASIIRNGISWILALGLLGMAPNLGAQSLGAPTTLEFGEVIVDPGGGSLTMDPSTGAVTPMAGVYLTSGLATSVSSITTTDKGGRTATVYTTVSAFSLSGTGGSFSTSTSPFSTNYPNDTFTFPGAQSQTTTVTVQLGGTLSIPGGMAAGDYTGYLPIYIRDDKGQNSNTVGVPVHIRILAPIALNHTQDLDLGTVIPGPTAGSLTLNAATGAESVTGGVLYAPSTGQVAQFSATGAPSHAFTITFGASSITLTGASGSMPFSLTSNLGGSSTFSAGGVATLNVGGTLSVGANQPEGDYIGTFTVTVAYP